MDIKAPIYSELYVNSEEFKDDVTSRVIASKKIKVEAKQVKPVVSALIDYFHYFNTFKENTHTILDRPISEIVVPAEFKDLLLPNAVRYDCGDRRNVDILVRHDTIEDTSKTYNDYINLIGQYRGFFKRAWNEDLVTLDSLRVDRSFEEVRSRAAVKLENETIHGIFVNYDGLPYIPLVVNQGFGFFGLNYWNYDDEAVTKDFIINLY